MPQDLSGNLHMPTLFYSLINNPDEWSNNDANDTNSNSYFYWVTILPLGSVLNFFLHILSDLILTKSKEEKTFKIPVSKTI